MYIWCIVYIRGPITVPNHSMSANKGPEEEMLEDVNTEKEWIDSGDTT